jgi:hypothetical protein
MVAPSDVSLALQVNREANMLAFFQPTSDTPAVVAHTDLAHDRERYLLVAPQGRPVWVENPESATAFASMREATRMATRLPAALRAYGLRRDVEVALHEAH